MEGNNLSEQLRLDFEPPNIKEDVNLVEMKALAQPLIKISKQISSILF